MKAPFESVVAKHGGTVLRVCRVLLATHDADDAWSETFISAMRAYPELPETANVEAWLVTIAHRKAIDQLRAMKRRPLPTEELPESPTGLGVPGAAELDLWPLVRDSSGQAAAGGGLPLRRRPSVCGDRAASSAAPSKPRAEPPPTASRNSGTPTRTQKRKEAHHEWRPEHQ